MSNLLQTAKQLAQKADKSNPLKRKLHLDLLKVFVDRGQGASASETLGFLQHLKRSRDEATKQANKSQAGSQRTMQRWSQDCLQHPGLEVLRGRLLAEDGLRTLEDTEISRSYNLLQRLKFQGEAESVWPLVAQRLAEQGLAKRSELLGVWAVAPKARLAELDEPLEKALRGADKVSPIQLLGVLTRANDAPESKAVLASAALLNGQLPNLDSEELAGLAGRLGRLRSERGAQLPMPKELQALSKRAKGTLLELDGKLTSDALLGLLGVLDGPSDALWPLVRRQFLTATTANVNAAQALDMYLFIKDRAPGPEDQKLRQHAASLLNKHLARKDNPGTVALVGRQLEAVLDSREICRGLCNAALGMRQDLYPTVLWMIFTNAGKAGLGRKHPMLKVRLQSFGETLEQHKVDRMPLKDMVQAAEAMLANEVVLNKCLDQMVQKFLDVYEQASSGAAKATLEAPAEGQNEAPADGQLESADSGELGATEALPPLGDMTVDLTSEVQQLMLSFWVSLRKLGVQRRRFTAAVEEFCTDQSICKLDPSAVLEALQALHGEADPEAKSVRLGLTTLVKGSIEKVSHESLIALALKESSQLPWLRGAVACEIGRRFAQGSFDAPRHGRDLDNLVAMLQRWSLGPVEQHVGPPSASSPEQEASTMESHKESIEAKTSTAASEQSLVDAEADEPAPSPSAPRQELDQAPEVPEASSQQEAGSMPATSDTTKTKTTSSAPGQAPGADAVEGAKVGAAASSAEALAPEVTHPAAQEAVSAPATAAPSRAEAPSSETLPAIDGASAGATSPEVVTLDSTPDSAPQSSTAKPDSASESMEEKSEKVQEEPSARAASSEAVTLESAQGGASNSSPAEPDSAPESVEGAPTKEQDDKAEDVVPATVVQQTMDLVIGALPAVLGQEPEVASRRLAATAGAFAAFAPLSSEVLNPLRVCLHQEAGRAPLESLAPDLAVDLMYNFSALHCGALPLDVAMRLWRTGGGVVARVGDEQELTAEQNSKLWAFGLAARHMSTPTVLAALRLAPEAYAMETYFGRLAQRKAISFNHDRDPSALARIDQLRKALPAIVPEGPYEGPFQIPGTPYVADLVLRDKRSVLLAPPAAPGWPCELNGLGKLTQGTLEAMGWQVHWLWSKDWDADLAAVLGPEEQARAEATTRLRVRLGFPDAGAAEAP